MNFTQVAGHLGSDPETRVTPSGQKVTNLRIASNSRKNGKDETIWWRVTLWGDRFDKLLPHLKKGSALIVVGELSKPEIYTDKEGHPQVTLQLTAEIIRFSPFGKPAESRTGEGVHQEVSGGEPQYGYGQDSGFSYAPPSSSYGGSAGRGNYNQEVNNDQIPF